MIQLSKGWLRDAVRLACCQGDKPDDIVNYNKEYIEMTGYSGWGEGGEREREREREGEGERFQMAVRLIQWIA